MEASKKRGRLVAVAVAGALAGSALLVPASAHINSPLTFKHLKKHFYTKKAANARFVNKSTLAGYEIRKTPDTSSFQGGNNPGFNLDAPSSLVLSLPLPAGNYLIQSTFNIYDPSSGLVIICELRAGAEKDSTAPFFGGNDTHYFPTALALGHTLATAGTAELRCDDGTASTSDSSLSRIEITAIRLPSLTETTST